MVTFLLRVTGFPFVSQVAMRKRRMDSMDSTSSEGDVFLSYTDQSGSEEEVHRILRHSSSQPETEKADVDEADCNYLNEVAFLILFGVFIILLLLLSSRRSPVSKQTTVDNKLKHSSSSPALPTHATPSPPAHPRMNLSRRQLPW